MLVEIRQIQLKWQSSVPVYISKVSPCTRKVTIKGRHKNEQKMPMGKSYSPDKYSDNITWNYLNCSAKSMWLYIQCYGVYIDLNKKHAMRFATYIKLRSNLTNFSASAILLLLCCCVDGKIILTGTLRFQLYSVVTGYKPATHGFYFIQNIAIVF